MGAVALQLDRPLWDGGDARSLVAQCSFAEYLVAQHQRLVRGRATDEAAACADALTRRVGRLADTARRTTGSASLADAIANAGLHASFPALHALASRASGADDVARVLADDAVASAANASAKRSATEPYLATIATVHQLASVAAQVQGDVSDPTAHKYIAHQLALVYQSLNHVGRGDEGAAAAEAVRPLKRRIEARFEEVKAHLERRTSDGSAPRLLDEHAAWIAQVSADAVALVHAFPPGIRDRLGTMGDVLRGGVVRCGTVT